MLLERSAPPVECAPLVFDTLASGFLAMACFLSVKVLVIVSVVVVLKGRGHGYQLTRMRYSSK